MADPETRLRGAGVRVTRQRLAVLAVLDRASREGVPLLVTEVADRTREILGRMSRQTVYACLDALADAGLARRVALPGAPVRFEAAGTDEHEHLVCTGCARLLTVRDESSGGRSSTGPPQGRHGFQVDHTEILHVGLCARCRRQRR